MWDVNKKTWNDRHMESNTVKDILVTDLKISSSTADNFICWGWQHYLLKTKMHTKCWLWLRKSLSHIHMLKHWHVRILLLSLKRSTHSKFINFAAVQSPPPTFIDVPFPAQPSLDFLSSQRTWLGAQIIQNGIFI